MNQEKPRVLLEQKPKSISAQLLPHLRDIAQAQAKGFTLKEIAAFYAMEPRRFYGALERARRMKAKLSEDPGAAPPQTPLEPQRKTKAELQAAFKPSRNLDKFNRELHHQ
ncbi:MAG: hypothetical protein P8104_04080 [Gammaproteobacteria bacterium]